MLLPRALHPRNRIIHLLSADSKTKYNAHEFRGCLVVESFSGSIVEFLGDGIQVKLGERGEVASFGEVVADEAVEVFV